MKHTKTLTIEQLGVALVAMFVTSCCFVWIYLAQTQTENTGGDLTAGVTKEFADMQKVAQLTKKNSLFGFSETEELTLTLAPNVQDMVGAAAVPESSTSSSLSLTEYVEEQDRKEKEEQRIAAIRSKAAIELTQLLHEAASVAEKSEATETAAKKAFETVKNSKTVEEAEKAAATIEIKAIKARKLVEKAAVIAEKAEKYAEIAELSAESAKEILTAAVDNAEKEEAFLEEALSIIDDLKIAAAEAAQKSAENSAWPADNDEAGWDFICAVGTQEGGPETIQAAYNRTKDSVWKAYGKTVIQQLTAPCQFEAYGSGAYAKYLGGNYPDSMMTGVKQIANGYVYHNYCCFRSASYARANGMSGVYIQGNVYFQCIR